MEKQTEYGALWIKTGAKGEYMTGNLTIGEQKIKVVAFKNTNKKNPNEPDWRILESKPQEVKPEDVVNVSNDDSVSPTEEINPEDIPF